MYFYRYCFGISHNLAINITAVLDFKETLHKKDIASTVRMTIARISLLFLYKLQSLTAEKNNNVGSSTNGRS